MAFNVTLQFEDSRGRRRGRRFYCTESTLAAAQAAVAALVANWDPMTDLAIIKATYTVEETLAIAGEAVSNVDENVSLPVVTDAGTGRDFDLPDVPDGKTTDGVLSKTDTDLIALMGNFQVGGLFRLNPIHPEAVINWNPGVLDK